MAVVITGTDVTTPDGVLGSGGSVTRNASDPAADTNPAGGVGTLWVNTTTGDVYVCTDATEDDNTWLNTGRGTDNINDFSATGGTVTTSGDYTYHTFTSSGNFVISASKDIDYLVVAGGGSGGNAQDFGATGAGGGGAGGYIAVAGHTISASTNAIVVGAGGAGQTAHANGFNGSNSSFLTSTAAGGGGGGFNGTGSSGGSGGGGGNTSGSGGAGTSGQGFAGGNSAGSDDGGGGGGAAEAGANWNSPVRHKGGDGKTWLDGNTYAGGGAGGAIMSNTGGAGGGGSSTAGSATGESGTVNTGGGGSGVGPADTSTSGAGGSGVVIIRYLTP